MASMIKPLSESYDRICINCYEESRQGVRIKAQWVCSCCLENNSINFKAIGCQEDEMKTEQELKQIKALLYCYAFEEVDNGSN